MIIPQYPEDSIRFYNPTWWFIPRIVSGLVHPSYKWTLPPLIPFITRVITHLLSGMNHQVKPSQTLQFQRLGLCRIVFCEHPWPGMGRNTWDLKAWPIWSSSPNCQSQASHPKKYHRKLSYKIINVKITQGNYFHISLHGCNINLQTPKIKKKRKNTHLIFARQKPSTSSIWLSVSAQEFASRVRLLLLRHVTHQLHQFLPRGVRAVLRALLIGPAGTGQTCCHLITENQLGDLVLVGMTGMAQTTITMGFYDDKWLFYGD